MVTQPDRPGPANPGPAGGRPTRPPHGRRLAAVAAVAGAVAAVWAARHVGPELPLGAVRGWMESQGVAGMFAFGAAYVGLVLLFVPGVALTLAAGAMYGPLVGVVVVAVATSVADAIAFLLARSLARRPVVVLRRRSRRLRAIDRALATGGWRVVALLRLNPTLPYSASNYLLGASRVRFVPYLVASGIFTLPAAFAYTYLGHVGVETLDGASRTPLEWGLMAMGLGGILATVLYVTRLARRTLAE